MSSADSAPRLEFSGSIEISCGDFSLQLRGSDQSLVADFPSVATLFRAKTIAGNLEKYIQQLPALPRLPSKTKAPSERDLSHLVPDIIVAVKSRPVGRILLTGAKPAFVPTPLSFFKKI